MRKFTGIILLFVLLAFVISGCGAQTQNADNQPAGNQPANGGQGQYVRPDLTGEVASITGNDVSLKIIQMPDFGQGNGPGGGNWNGNRQNRGQRNNNDQQNNGQQDNNQQNNDQQNNGQQGNGGGPGQGNGQGGGQFRNRQMNYTGETKTITISADIPVSTFVRGQNGREEQKVELKDIKQGNILQIWYSDKDKGTIARVSVMAFGNRQNNGPDGNGNGNGNANGNANGN